MILIGSCSEFSEQKSYPINFNGKNLLLIHQHDDYFLIENKCGHFGIELNDAKIKGQDIICAQHGIAFNLKTGLVTNRTYENCNPIKTYSMKIESNELFCINLV